MFKILLQVMHLLSDERCEYAVAHQDRTSEGALAEEGPFSLQARRLSELLGLSLGAVAKAISELAASGRLTVAVRASGRRPATYTLARPYTKHERRRGREPGSAASHGVFR